jgi:hypothetical protein
MSKENFFKRKEEIDALNIPDPLEYDMQNESDLIACGLSEENFKERNNNLFKDLDVDINQENPVATVCKRIEKTFSKREISFLLSSTILNDFFEQMSNENKTKNGK